jgi:hypothetical protein
MPKAHLVKERKTNQSEHKVQNSAPGHNTFYGLVDIFLQLQPIALVESVLISEAEVILLQQVDLLTNCLHQLIALGFTLKLILKVINI